MGTPTFWTEIEVVIILTDFNDVIPFFHDDSYSISVSELLGVGTTVLTMTLEDRDLGINQQLDYDLENDRYAIGGHREIMSQDIVKLLKMYIISIYLTIYVLL